MSAITDIQRAALMVRNALREDQITGMDCMRHVCIYIVARYITIERATTIGLPIKYAWENMISLLDQDGGAQTLYDLFCDDNAPDNIMRQFDRLFGTVYFIFGVTSPDVHARIMTIMNRVNIDTIECEIDLLGWVYEQHLRTGASAARDLGQFFTNRAICNYMIGLCDPHIKEDGTLETICDPTMGTGGFITTAIKYYSRANAHIDWRACAGAIHGCDSDSKVVAIAQMNAFMETKGVRANNVLLRNSLYDGLLARKYDIIVANPPFGLRNIVYDRCCESIRHLGICGKKSEPLFLQLIMASLAHGGRAAIILPTAFLDKAGAQFVNTRKYLVDNFHITRIIHISGNTFMNTKAGTSIITFVNDEYSTGDIDVMRITSDCASHAICENSVGVISREDIERSGNFSLDLGRYTIRFLITDLDMPGYASHLSRIFTIKDVCHMISGTQVPVESFTCEGLAVIKQANMSSGKLVPTEEQDYVSLDAPTKHARPMRDDIVVSTAYDCGRCARVTAPGWILSCDTYILRVRDLTQLNPLYLFWCIYSGGFYEMMQTLQRGTGVSHIRKDDIENAPIYVPSVEEQMDIVNRLMAISARKDEIRAQILALRQEMTQLQISARHALNPLFDDSQTDPPSQSRAKRDIFPHTC